MPAELVLVLVKEVVRVVVREDDEIEEVDSDEPDGLSVEVLLSVAELLADTTVALAELALPEAAVDVLVAVSDAIDIDVDGLAAAVVMVVVVGEDVGVQRKEMRFPVKI